MNWALEVVAMALSIVAMLVIAYGMTWFGYPVEPDAVGMAALGTAAYLFSRHLIDQGGSG